MGVSFLKPSIFMISSMRDIEINSFVSDWIISDFPAVFKPAPFSPMAEQALPDRAWMPEETGPWYNEPDETEEQT